MRPTPATSRSIPAAHALPHFALEVWAGVVFVNVDGQAAPLAERLAGVTRLVERFELDRYQVPTGAYAPETWTRTGS